MNIHDAVSGTLAAGTGRIHQFVRDEDGTIASFTEAVFDVPQRQASMRHRFLVQDADEPDDGPTQWVASVAAGDLLHFERPGDEPSWSTVRAAWPSACPVLVLYWLLGVTRVHSARRSATLPGGTVVQADLSVDAIVAAASRADMSGILASIDEADLARGMLICRQKSSSPGMV